MSKVVPNSLREFVREQAGASMVEYGMALIVIAVIGITAMNTLGGETRENVASACQSLTEASC